MAIEIPEIIPPHNCIGDGCEYGAAMNFFAADDGEGGINTSVTLHGLTMNQVAETLVRLFDGVAAESSEIPPVIAWARGREAMRQAIENSPAPEDAHNFIRGMMGETE